MKKLNDSKPAFKTNLARRGFLSYTGAGLAATGLLLVGCGDDDDGGGMISIGTPSNLTASQNDDGSVALSWTDNSTDEDGFVIERGTDMAGPFTEIDSVGMDTESYTDNDSDLMAGNTYYYRVAATMNTERSPYSNVASSMGGNAIVSLGEGDIGILNYAYALEQLEAAFYTEVIAGAYFSGATDPEKRILADIQKHEVAHRDFFKAAIADAAIPGLTPNFSAVDFDDRDSVLGTAKVFENLGVAAYNGAGKLIENVDYLVVAGKIVSVEARHASVINNLVNPGSTDFAGSPYVDANGLDQAMDPAEVLTQAADFIVNRIDASQLPTTS